jgi:hypothetical protein
MGADELHITTASFGMNMRQAIYIGAVDEVDSQVLEGAKLAATFSRAGCDPCPQLKTRLW